MGLQMRVEAIIAAGGYSTRFGRGIPKSLVPLGNATLLEMTLRSLRRSGVGRMIVINNRREYQDQIAAIIGKADNIELFFDRGYPNTFLLAQDFAAISGSNFFFCYGHAPRPSAVLRSMVERRGPMVVCSFDTSTKRKLIPLEGRFLEPPFLIAREALLCSKSSDWESFFSKHAATLEIVRVPGAHEFNSAAEATLYETYLRGLEEFAYLQGDQCRIEGLPCSPT